MASKQTDILNTKFKSADDIDNFFKKQGNGYVGFVPWWNDNHAGKGGFSNRQEMNVGDRWYNLWNEIEVMFNKPEINLLEFLCLNTIIINESSTFKPVSELYGSSSHKGISYTYTRAGGAKRSYNTLSDAGNKNCFELFNDRNYINAHGNKKFANQYRNTTDVTWKGEDFPPGNTSNETSGSSSFISEADFHKFRGRGFIQLTGRGNYKKIIGFIRNYDGNNSKLKQMGSGWNGKTDDEMATVSTNKDWDELFQKTDNIVAAYSLWAHAENTKYTWITPTDDENKLVEDIVLVSKRVAGWYAKKYHGEFKKRVIQQINSILGDDSELPEDTEGYSDDSSDDSGDGGSGSGSSGRDNNKSGTTPKVEGLTNFFKPTTVIPEPISFNVGDNKSKAKEIKSSVGSVPFISYGDIQIEPQYVKSFTFTIEELLPKINITFEDQYGTMKGRSAPLDDSKITIFIKSKSPALKSIFMRFKISAFSNVGGTYKISGVCDVNRMFLRKFESYPNMSSFDCLQDFAKKAGLGFNSNINGSDDKMTWINPGIKGEEFIKEVIGKSYISDTSFIWCYVDQYYNLNYIDVEEAFNVNVDADIGIHTIGLNNIKDFKDENKVVSLILTNDKSMVNSNNYFESWSMINNSTSISLERGYMNKTKFYDLNNTNFLIFNIDSSTGDRDNTIGMKSSPQDDEFYENHVTTSYIGTLDTDNSHGNYNYSVKQNEQNLEDVTKMAIRVNLKTPNFNLYRFKKIKVLITNESETPTHELSNERLSGFWLIIDIKYKQRDGKFSQSLTLVKRELELYSDEEGGVGKSNKNILSENTTNPDNDFLDADGDNVPDSIPEDAYEKWEWEIEWSNANEINNFFDQYNMDGFVGWFAQEFGNTPLFTDSPKTEVGDSSAKVVGGEVKQDEGSSDIINYKRWSTIWDNIPLIYNRVNGINSDKKSKKKVNGIEFLALNTLIYMLSGTDFKPMNESISVQNAFEKYNGVDSFSTYEYFNDEDYINENGNKPFADILKNTNDIQWDSNEFPHGFSTGAFSNPFYAGYKNLEGNITPGSVFNITFGGVTETYTSSGNTPNQFEFDVSGSNQSGYENLIDAINQDSNFDIRAYLSNTGLKKEIGWYEENSDTLKGIGISFKENLDIKITSDINNGVFVDTKVKSDYEKETSKDSNDFLTNCDFYKLRRRGLTPTIDGDMYMDTLDYIFNYSGDDKIVNDYKTKWSDKTNEINDNTEVTEDVKTTIKNYKRILKIIKNEDWDNLLSSPNINQATIAALSIFFYQNNKVHIINSGRSEDKVLKSIENIGKAIEKTLPDFNTTHYVKMVKEQIYFLDETELDVTKGIEGSPNPIAQKPKQADISKLEEGGNYDSFRHGKKIGSEETVIYQGTLISKKVAPSLITMVNEAKNDNIKLTVNSSFRTNEDQQVNGRTKSGQNFLYDIWKHTKGKHYNYREHSNTTPPLSRKGNLAAVPGTSNHQSGIAVDLSTGGKGSPIYEWLVANAWKYGFVRAVNRERWHWEYRPGQKMFSKVPLEHSYKGQNTWDDLPQKHGLA